jgi:L-iditol 2-dehydrogenase
MKALVYTGPKSIEYRDAPNPSPGDGEVLIRIESVGICGSDMHAYLGHDDRRPAPLILGHEAAGTVVSGLQKGRRVAVNPLVTCLECEACWEGRENLCPRRQIISMPPREGAFAQYIAMPERNLVTIPEGVPFSKAALAEPIACGWHGVKLAEKTLTKPLEDIAALVIGAGAIGVGAALSLKARGARDVIVVDANEGRQNFLPDRTGLDVRAPAAVASRDEFDLVVDAVGFAATRRDASLRVRPGGMIVHIGLGEAADGLDIRRMTLQEVTFIGSYTYTAADFRETAQAIFDGRLGPLDWIEERPLAEGANAFASLLAGRVSAPKIILNPSHD